MPKVRRLERMVGGALIPAGIMMLNLAGDSIFDTIDLGEGTPKRIPAWNQPLIYWDSETQEYIVNKIALEYEISKEASHSEEITELISAIADFANGNNERFSDIFKYMDEKKDHLRGFIFDLHVLPKDRYMLFIEMALNQDINEDLKQQIETISLRYEIRHLTTALAPYSAKYDIPGLATDDLISAMLEVDQLILDLNELNDKDFQVQATAIYIKLTSVQQQTDAHSPNELTERLKKTYGNSILKRISHAKQLLKGMIMEKFGVQDFTDLPFILEGKIEIDESESEVTKYWVDLLTQLGLNLDNIDQLKQFEIARNERSDALGTAGHDRITLSDTRPDLAGIQAPKRTTVHEISHTLEGGREMLRDFMSDMIKCAEGNYVGSQNYTEFNNWCREILYGFPLDKTKSYFGLANTTSKEALGEFVYGEAKDVTGNLFGTTISVPSEVYATTMDTIWTYFPNDQIPPFILEYAQKVIDINNLDPELFIRESNGMFPALYIVIATLLVECILSIIQIARKLKQQGSS